MCWNEEAFGRHRLRQRALEDVSRLDTRIRLLGRERAHPIVLAPTSNHMLVHPEGEVATGAGRGQPAPPWSSAPSPTNPWRRSPGPPRNPSGMPRTS